MQVENLGLQVSSQATCTPRRLNKSGRWRVGRAAAVAISNNAGLLQVGDSNQDRA